MTSSSTETTDLTERIIDRIEQLILEAESQTKPLELDPYRSQLFELFVTADGAGLTNEKSAGALSADSICRSLGLRWGLASAARDAVSQQSRIPPEHLARMRLLWSVMRMWMEWSYAWNRWTEFNSSDGETSRTST